MTSSSKKIPSVTMVCHRRCGGFTLVELLIVLAIMAVLFSLSIAAFNSIGDSQGVASETSDFQQMLDDARAYAMANNAFVFVGMEEVDASLPTSAVPQNLVSSTNGGRIAAVAVTTKDGTSTLTNNVVAISKLRIFPNIHLEPYYAFIGKTGRSYTGVTAAAPSPMANRVGISAKYYSLGYNATSSASSTSEYFNWPLTGTAQYSFNRIIQFSPDGSACLVAPSTNSRATYTPTWLEIDFEEMHGYALSTVPTYTSSLSKASTGHQVVAIQIDGITGSTQLFQQ